MRRYWFPIVLLLMIVVSIGTFYIRGVASDLPEYVLVPQHGKVEEAEGVIVRGDYVVTDISSPTCLLIGMEVSMTRKEILLNVW